MQKSLSNLSIEGMRNTKQDLWAITSYYNPFHGKLRARNYYNFNANLNVPLITIEWSHSGEFELNENDADILVQISGGDILWQKERLLNIALEYLPPQVKYVAWIDCDVIFENTFWYLEAIELLKSNDIIQLFDEAYLLKPNSKLIINAEIAKLMPYEKIIKSATSQFLNGKYSIDLQDTEAGLAGPGLAFAAHASLIKRNKFYDASIVGGGDSFFFHALMNNIDEFFSARFFSKHHKNHFREWYKRLNKDNKIGYLPNKIYHMYHGAIKNRQYISRELILFNHQYDPNLHIEISDNKIWKFANPQNNPLKDEILNYMQLRKDC